MDAFEQLVGNLLGSEGYWVKRSIKVALTKEDKARIGRTSSPRWEIDVVAYHATQNRLLAIECKSYLDSGGVHAAHFDAGSRYAHRYKLFHEPVLRETVLARLKQQCVAEGYCPADADISLGLAYGHATPHNDALIRDYFCANGWLLFGPDWLRTHLQRIATGSYENSMAAIVAKLLLRSPGPLCETA